MVSCTGMNHSLHHALIRVGNGIAWARRAGATLFPLRVGIALRLSAAFAAVIILAAAANFLAEQGVAIVARSEAVVVEPPLPPVAVVEPAPQPAARDPVVPQPQRLSSAPVVLAIDRFSQAVHSALQSAAPEDRDLVQQNAVALATAGEKFQQQAGRARPRSLAGLNQDIATYSQQGNAIVALADQRREATRDYAARVESMNGSAKQSLDGAWKIFGRVVARQSLIRLGAGIDDIRRRSVALASADGYDSTTIAAIEAAESQFAMILEENARNFERADGSDWLQQMRNDYSQMVRLRTQIVDLDQRRQDGDQQFQFSRARLLASLPETVVLPVSIPSAGSTPRAPPALSRSLPAQSASAAAPVQPPSVSVPLVAAPVDATPPQEASVPASIDGKRTLVAWLSAAVLLFVVSISLFTVRSIVGPVRRLMRATAELAIGAIPAPLPRGGIKELDTLAVAFNDMAQRLATAQELTLNHQRDLEVKVEQRTRELRTLAERDPLTLLPNRRQLFALLNEALAQAEARGGLVGLFFVDIDNFKNLNDSVDHVFGDRVLVGIARRLEKVAEAFGFAARLGGDEFTVVHTRAEKAEDIRLAGIALLEAFNEPLLIDGRELHVSISVGASVFPEHDRDAESLLRAADAALFRAKALGRNQLSIFTPDLLRDMAEKFTTEQGLRRAIERGEFELVFQPELDLETMQVSLCEALIRWRLPDGRMASPQEFLAVAEESGLILDISAWVLRAAVQAAAHWHHGDWPEACVAINISPRQLLDRQFTDNLLNLLAEHRLPPHCIELELTETVLQTGATTIETLKRLKACGFAIALDDFGTGYSSLASLEQLPISRIKLDRSLIAGIDTKARSAAITRAIILMCQGLDLRMTAEGVERAEQLRELREFRGLCVQGYLFSKPVPRDQLLGACLQVEQDAERLLAQLAEEELQSPAEPLRQRAV
jgi:diguanylate cyclase (GGDEF)-like protein